MTPIIKRPIASPKIGARPAAFNAKPQAETSLQPKVNKQPEEHHGINRAQRELEQHIKEGQYEDSLGKLLLQNDFVSSELHHLISNKIVSPRKNAAGLLQRNFLVELYRAGEGHHDKISDFLTRLSSLPYIQLSNFVATPFNPSNLSADLCESLGFVIFGESEKLIEVAIHNPLDEKLKELLEWGFSPVKVSFFLTGANSIESYYKQLRFNNHAAENSLFSRR